MKGRVLVAAIVVAAIVAFLILRRGHKSDGTATTTTTSASGAPGSDHIAEGGPERDLPKTPAATLPPGVPTRAEANATRTAPPVRPELETTETATPMVVAELNETVGKLTERARECATGKTVEVEVQMTYREGTAYVRQASIAGDSLGEALDQCIVDKLTNHTWTVAGDDKVFGMTIALQL